MQTRLPLLLIALALLQDNAHGLGWNGVLIVGGLKESGECCQGSVELWSPNFQCKFPGSNGGMVDGSVDLLGDRVVACGGKYINSKLSQTVNTTSCNQLWLESPPGIHWRRGMWESGAFKTIHPRSRHTSVVTCSSVYGCSTVGPSKDLLLLGGEYSPDTSEVIQLDEWEKTKTLVLATNCNTEKELRGCTVNMTKVEEGESKETFPFVQGSGGPGHGHCPIRVDARHIVLTGGHVKGESLASVNQMKLWQGIVKTMSLPDLISPREGHACGIYRKGVIKTLIVTGGVFKNQGQEHLLDSTEVFSGTKEGFPQRLGAAWRVVPLLPSHRRISPKGATLDNTFYLIGGLDSNKKARRDILRWDPNSEVWVESGELMFARGGHAVTTVPIWLAKQHCEEAVGFATAGFVSTSSASSLSWLLHPTNLLFVAFEVIF